MLRVERLNVYYGEVQVLFDVSLAVRPGEIVSIVGANAAGKTTLLLSISGLLKRKTGHIRFEEQPLENLAPNAIVDRGIVHIPQGRRMFPMLSVEENLESSSATKTCGRSCVTTSSSCAKPTAIRSWTRGGRRSRATSTSRNTPPTTSSSRKTTSSP